MNSSILKQVLAGVLLGFVVTIAGSFIGIKILLPNDDLQNIIAELLQKKLLTKIMTLGTLPNALVFYLLIKNKRDYIARGVLMAIIILAVLFAILKYYK